MPCQRLAILVCTGLLGCAAASLPDYAAPSGGLVDPATYDTSDLIPYRRLTRADFRAESVPGPFAAVSQRVGAATCGYVRTTPETRILAQPVQAGDSVRYRAQVDTLGFAAYMDRHCSWWNDANHVATPEYVLEHEQIHFALFELQARALDRRAPEIAATLVTTADSPEQAQAELQERLGTALQEGLEDVLHRSHRFDSDTSLGEFPEKQAAWLRTVQAELAATGGGWPAGAEAR